ncbi:hypothetical protein CTheo_5020 [Ceratobasidium theobromae]|uniref:Uncharacterized protein n=1 Tax=Ceratobasidium theobromae TaxID=1582974 RepID=A0A5N5QJ13_9AGAM|nr:hypothetical protein CTheo_5020 [Ceratobasidium theobromae]
MAKTEATTRLANDPDFLNHVIKKLTEDSQTERTVKTGFTDDQDAEKIAEDALAIRHTFENLSDELEMVDAENWGQNWSEQWKEPSFLYNEALDVAQVLAQKGAKYIDDFYEFSPTLWPSIYKKDVITKRLNDWFKLSDKLTEINSAFTQFAIKKGAANDQKQGDLQRQIKHLQYKIDWQAHSLTTPNSAAKMQSVLNEHITGLTMVSSILTLPTVGPNRNTTLTYDLNFRKKKNEIAKQATELAKEKSRLNRVQVALSILTHDVADITTRVNWFANLWIAAHNDYIELQRWAENDYNDQNTLLRKRLEALESAGNVFLIDMKRLANALKP